MLHLEVYGYTWGGFKAVYIYTPKDEATKVIANPKAYANDFQDVLDYRVVEETNSYEHVSHGISRRVDTFKVLRGFRNGMTPKRFYRIANGVA